ncbi:MBL fold metallo-hydrolase [Clostridium sp. MSJ-11]|uniref:MBL fold metallo-hydrolase n=1 Tax=Clostridium mobile TaxID=2841512 RepID=A0ABS6EKD4_9CLOT|nr:MBL fold metallo-hydrolase [Clostridium mobile]MBU5485674.1 MBL fold metallo-hydrolase [Clostridium mobile]
MKIIGLMENTTRDEELVCEHGLCIYIEFGDRKILLDTGGSGSFVSNGEKLGVNIEKVDMVVLSHGHLDHGGGLLSFFSSNNLGEVYLKKEAVKDYYLDKNGEKIYIGLNKDVVEDNFNRLQFVDGFTQIDKNIFIVTDILKEYPLPQGNNNLYMEEKSEEEEPRFIKDSFQHELILVFKVEDGLIIFTGCAHNGIINIIETIKSAFPEENIKGIVGGFHLMIEGKWDGLCMEDEYIDNISQKIIEEGIGKVYTGHCTGENGYARLKEKLGDKVEYLSTGAKINI